VRSRYRRAVAAPLLVAAAALAAAGCGGTAGGRVSETVTALRPVACAIEHAGREDANYATALSNVINGFTFSGVAEDDLSSAANRQRIFTARIDDLRAQAPALAALSPGDDLERRLVSAARRDLAAMMRAMRYDLQWAPGDPNAPPSADLPTGLGDVAQTAPAAVRRALGNCPALPDQDRRTKAYAS
jgi:hypothetical protein